MAASGEQLDLHDTIPFAIDKHSSGGVGDKTTLIAAPIAASTHPFAKWREQIHTRKERYDALSADLGQAVRRARAERGSTGSAAVSYR